MKPVEPICTVELFPALGRELLALLRALQPDDWARSTACAGWSVKDVAAHLLGGSLGRLWELDGTASNGGPALGNAELVALINRSNALWVEAARRISPTMLVELLELTDRRLYEHFCRLDPHAPAPIAVAWAGDDTAPNWFDIAREHTEKWLHQQHIREAVGQPLLTERRWLFPVLDTFLRGLPHAFRGVQADAGVAVVVQIAGDAGGAWSLVREGTGWRLYAGEHSRPTCRVRLDQALAWRLFTKGVTVEDVRRQVVMEGDAALGEHALAMVSIMA